MSAGIRLFFASFAALVAELALIRTLPAYARVVGYFSNVVLVASFFGLGVGALLSDRLRGLARQPMLGFLPILLALLPLSTLVVSNDPNLEEWLWLLPSAADHGPRLGIASTMCIVYVLVAFAFVPLGQRIGRAFTEMAVLRAYAIDLAGSLAGVAAFGLLSWLRTSPTTWIAVVAIAVWISGLGPVADAERRRVWRSRGLGAALSVLAVALAAWPARANDRWSAYYRLDVTPEPPLGSIVHANGNRFQFVLDFDLRDQSFVKRTRDRFAWPYTFAERHDDVLVVGAGTGNDVVIALEQGARRVDAVEIDPVLLDLGRDHPQHPYADPRVHPIVDDARHYFRSTDRRYDVVVFGTLDSQALLSGLSSVRLDNYVYTEESFQDAHRLLRDGGVLVVHHQSVAHPTIAVRIHEMLARTFGKRPVSRFYPDFTMFSHTFVAGDRIAEEPENPALVEAARGVRLPNDDWPFLYLVKPGIPRMYVSVLGVALLTAAVAVGWACRGRARAFDPVLFFLGAGFLLLETKAVTESSLLFGSTWVVNAVVVAAILAVLGIANLLVSRFGGADSVRRAADRRERTWLVVGFAVLVGVLLLYSQVEWRHAAIGMGFAGRAALASVHVGAPIAIAGLLFPALFRRSSDRAAALGSNLLGAVVGGAAEYTSLVFGLHALSSCASLLYACAAVAFFWRSRRSP